MDAFDQIEKLPENVRVFFGSNSPRVAVEKACFLYDVPEEKITDIAGLVGDIFYGDLELSRLPLKIASVLNLGSGVAYGISCELNKNIFSLLATYFVDAHKLLEMWGKSKTNPIVSEEKAQRRVLDIEPWILEEEKEKKNKTAEARKKIESIGIEAALLKYPNLGEQAVSNNPLKLRQFANSVRPSIRNWITDYRDNMGAGRHGSIDRGNYLFHGDNGKKLTPVERRNLSELLRSLDEKTSINIDIEAQAPVFSGAEKGRGIVPGGPEAPETQAVRSPTLTPRHARSHPHLSGVPDIFSLEGEEDLREKGREEENFGSADIFQRYSSLGGQSSPRSVAGSDSPAGIALNRPVRGVVSQPEDEHIKEELISFFSGPQNENPAAEADSFRMPRPKPPIGSDSYFTRLTGLAVEKKPAAAAPEMKAASALPSSVRSTGHLLPEREKRTESETSGGSVSFSSPQKLPVEQSVSPAMPLSRPVATPKPAMPQPRQKPQPVQIKPQPQTPWHIGPTGHFHADDKKDVEPKIDKNTVDLRNP